MPLVPKSDAGFTLAEVLLTVALVALLLAISVPALQGVRERVAFARTRAELALIAQALEQYRRAYGDYPQTGDFAQAAATLDQPLATDHAQSKLFNALTGVFGPTALTAGDHLDGPEFIDATKLTVEAPGSGLPGRDEHPVKPEVRAALLDPWGRRYLYYYKRASAAAAWTASTYWLYSAGPDGRHQPPDATSGAGEEARSGEANADNVWGSAPR
jgi:prepilin-type N-terminal cleavage/methylation domain-containing protein